MLEGVQRVFQILNGTTDLTIDHTTAINAHSVIVFSGAPNANFVYTNNIASHNDFGVIGADIDAVNAATEGVLTGQ